MRCRWILIAGLLLWTARGLHGNPSVSWSGTQDFLIGIDDLGGIVGPANLWIDFDSDGVDDLHLFYGVNEGEHHMMATPRAGAETIVHDPFPPSSVVWSAPLDSGTPIGASPPSPLYWDHDLQRLLIWIDDLGEGLPGAAGPWVGVDHGYLGVSFEKEEETYYGWVQMSVPNEFAYAVVHDWAYETTPGIGINAGVVPEPATIGLFALGLAALLARRLRRARGG